MGMGFGVLQFYIGVKDCDCILVMSAWFRTIQFYIGIKDLQKECVKSKGSPISTIANTGQNACAGCKTMLYFLYVVDLPSTRNQKRLWKTVSVSAIC